MADNPNSADLRRGARDAMPRALASGPADAERQCSGCAETRHDGSDTGNYCASVQPKPDEWSLLAIGEVHEFAGVRRAIGRARSDRVIAAVIRRATELVPTLAVTVAGRSSIEIEGAVTGPDDAQRILACLDVEMRKPLSIGGHTISLQMRFAGATAPAESTDEVALIEAAEAAIARARTLGATDLIDLTRPDEAIDRAVLMRELPAAIEAGDLFLQYQPKIHLRHQRIASAEALVRWNHRTRGLILPGAFIAAAEESGGIGPLTVWTLRQVIADQRKLRARGHDFTIFINISGQLLADRGFVDTVREIMTGSDAAIGFEITETSVIRDPESAIAHLRAFAALGIPLAIDDYGAGLSSLSYLKQLPARELKIDKLFVTQLTSSNRDPLIVRSTIDLAHALDMEVTAEGVESPAALALLSVMGCDMAQGYLISRPVGIDAFITYCDEDRHLELASNARPGFGNPASFWRRSG